MNKRELKEYEERYSNIKLNKKMSIGVIADGKNFKKLTEKFNKPFDKVLSSIMEATMNEVAPEIDGCQLAYTQSDEIVFLLSGNNPIYNYSIEDMCSVIGSKISVSFYSIFLKFILDYQAEVEKIKDENKAVDGAEERIKTLWEFLGNKPTFAVHVFEIPYDEESDLFEIRQNVCINNSIHEMAHYYLNDVNGKTQKQLRGELYDVDKAWEREDEVYKFGSGIARAKDKDGIKWVKYDFRGEHATSLEKKKGQRKE